LQKKEEVLVFYEVGVAVIEIGMLRVFDELVFTGK